MIIILVIFDLMKKNILIYMSGCHIQRNFSEQNFAIVGFTTDLGLYPYHVSIITDMEAVK